MRPVFILTYLLWYFVISTGVLISVHKCGGHVVSVDFFKATADACGSSGCEDDGCCENETRFYKLTTDQKLNAAIDLPAFQTLFFEDFEYPNVKVEHLRSFIVPPSLPIRPPPDLSPKTPLFIKNRVLII